MRTKLYIITLSFFALVLVPCSALCDEAAIDVYGGSAKLKDGNATEIRMDSETVRIELGQSIYTVDATFEFYNEGGTTTVTVGFPQFGEGYIGPKGVQNFYSFQTWVNGIECQVKRVHGAILTVDERIISPDELTPERRKMTPYYERKWLVKEVTFPSQEKTITRVRYSAPYGTWDSAVYLYGTGRSWKGNIGEARFIVKSTPKAWLYNFDFGKWAGGRYHVRKYGISRLSEYECELVLRNFKPEEWESFSMGSSTHAHPWTDFDTGTFCEGQGWEYDKKVIPDEMLDMLSSKQLRLFRNTFYAVHGKIFQSQELNNYFKNEQRSCYKPNPDFKESDLNDIEKANIQKIADYEKKNAELLKKK